MRTGGKKFRKKLNVHGLIIGTQEYILRHNKKEERVKRMSGNKQIKNLKWQNLVFSHIHVFFSLRSDDVRFVCEKHLALLS